MKDNKDNIKYIIKESLVIAFLSILIGVPLHILSLYLYKKQDLNDMKMFSIHIFMIYFISFIIYKLILV